jgi:hypothetical protein
MTQRIMFDIETLDTKRTSVVLTVGYAIFGKERIVASGQVHFNTQLQLDMGRTVSADTLFWWFKQIAKAPQLIKPFTQSTPNDHTQYMYWLHDLLGKTSQDEQTGPEISEVWANGPNFDLAILKDLFYGFQYAPSCPWAYWQERDYRTFIKQAQLAGIVLPERPADLPLHDAESDARWQAEMVLYVEQVQRDAMHALAVGAHRKAKAVAEIDEVEGGGTVDCSLTEVPPENDPVSAELASVGPSYSWDHLDARDGTRDPDEEMHEVDFDEEVSQSSLDDEGDYYTMNHPDL